MKDSLLPVSQMVNAMSFSLVIPLLGIYPADMLTHTQN